MLTKLNNYFDLHHTTDKILYYSIFATGSLLILFCIVSLFQL